MELQVRQNPDRSFQVVLDGEDISHRISGLELNLRGHRQPMLVLHYVAENLTSTFDLIEPYVSR